MKNHPQTIGSTLILAGMSLCAWPAISQTPDPAGPAQEQPAREQADGPTAIDETNQPAKPAEPAEPAGPLSVHELAPPSMIAGLLQVHDSSPEGMPEGRSAEEFIEQAELPEPVANPKPLASPPLAEAISKLLETAQVAVAEGRYYDAIQVMREAHRLAPSHPRVLRELGLIYAASGNEVRSEQYLTQTIRHDPQDIESLLLLTRFTLKRGETDQALSWTMAMRQAAAESKSKDAQHLVVFYEAEVLASAGYGDQAVQRYREVLEYEPVGDAGAAVAREWFVIERRASSLWMHIGDLMLAEDQVDQADQAYDQVDPAILGPTPDLVPRRAYVDLLKRDHESALQRIAEHLASPNTDYRDASLVDYLQESGVRIEQIKAVLNQRFTGDRATLAMLAGLSRIESTKAVVELASAYFEQNTVRSEQLPIIYQMLGFEDTHDPELLAAVVRLTAEAMARQPRQADAYADALLSQKPDPVTLIRVLKQGEFGESKEPWLAYLSGRGFASVGRYDLAAPILASALVELPDQSAVRFALAKLLYDEATTQSRSRDIRQSNQVDMTKLREAKRLLSDVQADSDWESFKLLVEIHQQLNESHDVVRLIVSRTQQVGLDPEMRVYRATKLHEIQRLRLTSALNMLVDLIAERPSFEPAYDAAFDLIDNSDEEWNDEILAIRRRLVQDLMQHLPQARMSLLIQYYRVADEDPRAEQIGELLNAMLELNPDDVLALYLLSEYHQSLEQPELARQMNLRLIMTEPPGVSRRIPLANHYIETGEVDRAVALIEKTLAEEKEGVLPGRALDGDTAAALIAPLSAAGLNEQADPLYLDMVRRFPNSARLNNALGYRWAVQGKNLNHAKAMIQRAIDIDGENSAYLDSMAWVLYRRGEYAQAQAYQSQALEALRDEQLRFGMQMRASKAVLYDHMGDILYRLDDQPAAVRHWQIARAQRVSDEEIAGDPELQTLQDRVNAKITATRNGENPPLDPIVPAEDFGPQGHPADRPGNPLGAVPQRPGNEPRWPEDVIRDNGDLIFEAR